MLSARFDISVSSLDKRVSRGSKMPFITLIPWTLLVLLSVSSALPDRGKFSFTLNSTLEYGGVAKNVYNQTK